MRVEKFKTKITLSEERGKLKISLFVTQWNDIYRSFVLNTRMRKRINLSWKNFDTDYVEFSQI